MEVQSLTLQVADADLDALAAKLLPPDSPIEDLRIRLKPEGACVSGMYPLLVNVSFECWWTVTVENGKAIAKIARLKAFGMPATVFKSAVLKSLETLAKDEFWIAVKGDEVQLDLEAFLSRHACPAKLNLRRISFQEGFAIVEAGATT